MCNECERACITVQMPTEPERYGYTCQSFFEKKLKIRIPDKICKGNSEEVHSMARPAMHTLQLNLILAQAQALYFTHANIQIFVYQPCERVRAPCVFVYA
jgi:hypothetical protein